MSICRDELQLHEWLFVVLSKIYDETRARSAISSDSRLAGDASLNIRSLALEF